MYNDFISKFESRLNPIILANIASTIAHSTSNYQDSIIFLNRVLANRTRLGLEATLCLEMDIVLVKLKMGELNEAKLILDSAYGTLPSINISESIVFSKYYLSSTEYRKVIIKLDLYLY